METDVDPWSVEQRPWKSEGKEDHQLSPGGPSNRRRAPAPLVIAMVPMIPLVKTVCSQYCRQSTVLAKLPKLKSHVIQ